VTALEESADAAVVTDGAEAPGVGHVPPRRGGIVGRLVDARTGVLLLVVGAIAILSIFAFVPIAPRNGLIRDRELVFFLSGRTAKGDLPLVDFQHGWNAGGWWVGAVLYRLADGSPNVFAFLFEHVFGRILAFSALAAAVWRLPRSAGLIAAVGIGSAAWAAVGPPNAKYAIPALWVFSLLPTPAVRRSRRGLVLYAGVALLTFWLHVELAVLLSAGVGFFELFGAERERWRDRVERVGALGVGLALGLASEVAFYAAHGVSPSTVNDFVLGGQTGVYPQQYGWSLSAPAAAPAALFLLFVLGPFVPLLWRRASPEVRLAACLSLATAIVALRRDDHQHVAAVSTLFVFTGVLLVDDLRRGRLPQRSGGRGAAIGMVLAGVAWAAVVVFVVVETESLLAGAALMVGAAAATLAARHGDWTWASAGALSVLALIAVAGSTSVMRDKIRSTDPFTQVSTNAQAIAPEVDRCLGDDHRAVIATTQLSLYDYLALRNPTPYVQFYYDFVRYAPDLADRMQAGEVPAFVQVYPLPDYMAEVSDELARDYVPCSRIAVPATGNTITIWVDADRAPAEQRRLRAEPGGRLVPVDAAT
jgi:hypothetical protein